MPLEMAVVHKFRQRELRVWATPNLTPNVNPKIWRGNAPSSFLALLTLRLPRTRQA
jgi:hypothetical protein